jgi:hypothetical protein
MYYTLYGESLMEYTKRCRHLNASTARGYLEGPLQDGLGADHREQALALAAALISGEA